MTKQKFAVAFSREKLRQSDRAISRTSTPEVDCKNSSNLNGNSDRRKNRLAGSQLTTNRVEIV